VGQGLLIHEVSRSHTTTHHSRWDSSGRVISSSQRPLPDNTQHSQQTNIHAPRWYSNPQSQQAIGRRPTSQTARLLGPAMLNIFERNKLKDYKSKFWYRYTSCWAALDVKCAALRINFRGRRMCTTFELRVHFKRVQNKICRRFLLLVFVTIRDWIWQIFSKGKHQKNRILGIGYSCFTPLPNSWRAWHIRPNSKMNNCGQDLRHSSSTGLLACRHYYKIWRITISIDSCWYTFTGLTDRGVGVDVFWSVGNLLILAVTRDKALNSLDPRISMHADKGRNLTHYSRLFSTSSFPVLFFF